MYVAGFNKIFNCKLNKIMNFKQHSEILFISSYCPYVVLICTKKYLGVFIIIMYLLSKKNFFRQS